MKLLTDENVSPDVIRALRAHDHDVRDVKEEQWHGAVDEWIVRKARTERRIIVSEDLDFANLRRFPLGIQHGAVLPHFANMHPRYVAERLVEFLDGVRPGELRGRAGVGTGTGPQAGCRHWPLASFRRPKLRR